MSLRVHSIRLRLTLITGAGILLAMAFLYGQQAAGAQEETLNVGAGVGTGTIAGNVFAPGEFTVHSGDSVKWTIASDEPHTVTFGENPEGGPPPSWPATFDIPPGPPVPVDLGPVDFSGSGFINTGVIFRDSTLTVRFPETGSFIFNCVIHPGMSGTVHVVAADQETTTQTEADQKAQATESQILGMVGGLRTEANASVTSEQRGDGTSLWKMFTNTMSDVLIVDGGGSGYLEILEFFPPDLPIKQGDTVLWQATAPHTVTFLAQGQTSGQLLQQSGGDPFGVPLAKPSEQYDGVSLYHSGTLAFGPPGSPETFQLTFPDQGEFPYVCLIHEQFGHTGTIAVSARTVAATATPSATPSPAASPTLSPALLPSAGGAGEDGSDGSLWLAIALGAALISGAVFGASRLVRR